MGEHTSGGQQLSQLGGWTSQGETPDLNPKVNEEKLELRLYWTGGERAFQPEGAACSKARMWGRQNGACGLR